MTEERLAELERLEQAATPGPWDTGMLSMERVPSNSETDWHQLGADEKLAVAARNGLPELLAEVRRLRACREALRLCLAEYVEEYGSASCDCEEPDCWVRKAVKALEDIPE